MSPHKIGMPHRGLWQRSGTVASTRLSMSTSGDVTSTAP
ncbi:hypothetical protein I542_5150 [Mycobacteroides abscessus 1948]|uniref:Uncharacterized protein n=1 Tax=Mycobacteroides abscessus 1948 TaxID=1299323 RepID=A0A829QP54_9MYCO|nr:hypothetical protein I542_5150 [Mycobacteroides abscessus 1948]